MKPDTKNPKFNPVINHAHPELVRQAGQVPIADAGTFFTGTTVEEALQELAAAPGGGGLTPGTYTITNDTTDRTFDANSITLNELADVVATIIRDLGGD